MLLPNDLELSSYEIHDQLQSYDNLDRYFDGAKGKFEAL